MKRQRVEVEGEAEGEVEYEANSTTGMRGKGEGEGEGEGGGGSGDVAAGGSMGLGEERSPWSSIMVTSVSIKTLTDELGGMLKKHKWPTVLMMAVQVFIDSPDMAKEEKEDMKRGRDLLKVQWLQDFSERTKASVTIVDATEKAEKLKQLETELRANCTAIKRCMSILKREMATGFEGIEAAAASGSK